MHEYEDIKEGEWIYPLPEEYKLICCDCGLTHDVDFRIINGHVEFRTHRNEDWTDAIRKKMSFPLKMLKAVTPFVMISKLLNQK